MSEDIKITRWYRKNSDGTYSFNHIEPGHVLGDKPQPKLQANGVPFPGQSGWAKSEWVSKFGLLVGSKVESLP